MGTDWNSPQKGQFFQVIPLCPLKTDYGLLTLSEKNHSRDLYLRVLRTFRVQEKIVSFDYNTLFTVRSSQKCFLQHLVLIFVTISQ